VRIRGFLRPPASQYAALDPCIGDGGAFAIIASDALALRYGIELDSYRAERARQTTPQVIQGDACNVHCPVESFSLLYLNPPYDFECGEGQNRRMEQIFLEHSYRWLKPGGVLVLVIPGDRLDVCDKVLASHFRDKKAYRLSAADSEKYKQVVLFGIRRTRRERDRLRDADVIRARGLIAEMKRTWNQLPRLPDIPDAAYSIPESRPVELVYRGLPLDEIEDLLPRSAGATGFVWATKADHRQAADTLTCGSRRAMRRQWHVGWGLWLRGKPPCGELEGREGYRSVRGGRG
jgi:SAM-dependent methyltransferase